MATYTVSTNLISWVPAQHGIFGWPADLAEAELVRAMKPGDLIVPKFAQNPEREDQADYQRTICEAFGERFEEQVEAYHDTVRRGAAAVPFVMRVRAGRPDAPALFDGWSWVGIERLPLKHPISTSHFLRLRMVPIELASQFKAMAAPGRRIQRLSPQAGQFVLNAGELPELGRTELRTLTLVRASDVGVALANLAAAGLEPIADDRAFLVADREMAGLHVSDAVGWLSPRGQPIAVPPDQLKPLLQEAAAKAHRSDSFRPSRGYLAADDLVDFLGSGEPVRQIPEYAQFHDRFALLDSKVTQAREIAARPVPSRRADPPVPVPPVDDDEGENPEHDDLEKVRGLSVEAVEKALPEGMVLTRSVLAEAVTALRSGKHLLLSGPPGTGKSTVAIALCRAVMDSGFHVVTATADWTTFDTIGGYLPQPDGTLEFSPGAVLRSLDTGEWLVIDELNRADVDKAFGPLFTLLASSDVAQQRVQLPYRHADGKANVEIAVAPTRADADARYAVTPAWRVIGTMNAADKASLFQLSFAFLRRFAVIDVPLPEHDAYGMLIAEAASELPDEHRAAIAAAALDVAFGPIPLGPAILRDALSFTERGLVPDATGNAPYDHAPDAFLTALRLYAVPQYEGASDGAAEKLLRLLQAHFPAPPATAWAALERALDGIVLATA